MLISSTSNDRIKNVVRLVGNRRHRERLEQTVVEGNREVRRCLEANIVPVEAYICPEIVTGENRDIVDTLHGHSQKYDTRVVDVTPDVYAKLAYRGASGGIVLVIPYTLTGLDDLPLSDPAFLVVVEGAEKPGNIGAILRTADAAGTDGLVLCSGGTDLHNPNVIRASLGTRFTVPVAEAPTDRVISWLRHQHITTVAAHPNATVTYTAADMRCSLAIVTGSEAEGLSPDWLQAADEKVAIPMYGASDSLNLATSTALLLYEVLRQREVLRQQNG